MSIETITERATKAIGRTVVQIPPPRFAVNEFVIVGTAPYVQARFAQKAMLAMRAKHEAGSAAKKGKKREARDFNADYEGAKHISTDGWIGIPAGGLRQASISACRLVGFKMTLAKLSIFFEADGFDAVDGTPLIRIVGDPEVCEMPVRNATGVIDIRVRPMWREWSATLRIRYDLDQFSQTDVANLLQRVGMQVGIGEGRPDSKSSSGLGWGLFKIAEGE
jgi:hypothetical protein